MGKILNIEEAINNIENNKDVYVMFTVETTVNIPIVYITQCNNVKIKMYRWNYSNEMQYFLEPKGIKEYIGTSKIVSLQVSSMVEDNGTYITLEKGDDTLMKLRKYITFDLGTAMKLVWKTYYNTYRNSETKFPREKLIADYKTIKEKIKQLLT